MKILIADDYSDTLRIYTIVLERSGHEVVGARNGEEAWGAFRTAVHVRAPFGLMLLDVAMPVMGGLECAKLIRRFEKEQGMTPARLIFLSAHLAQVSVDDVARLGIESIEQKPIGLNALRALVK